MTAVMVLGTRRTLRVVQRSAWTYLRLWPIFLSGFFEPLFYLLSVGVGVGSLVGDVAGPGGEPIPYEVFVAPAMLAVSAMNGTIFDTTFVFFYKFKYAKTFEGMLATPLGVHDVARGELVWAVLRGTVYAVAFLVTMAALGLTESAWSVLAIPGALLIGLAFGGVGLGLTTFMRSWVDFDYVPLSIIPLMLFSATFFPLDQYPEAVAWLVRFSPLYQGVALERALVLGDLSPVLLAHAAYLAVMGLLGLRLARRRLGRYLLP